MMFDSLREALDYFDKECFFGFSNQSIYSISDPSCGGPFYVLIPWDKDPEEEFPGWEPVEVEF